MTMLTDAPPLSKRFKMALLGDNFIADAKNPTNNGRYPKGAVLLVDEETAIRWYENGIAEIAPVDAPTFGEIRKIQKRDEFLKRAVPAEGVFDQMVSRQSLNQAAPRPSGQDAPRDSSYMPTMPTMPVPRRGRGGKRLDLAGADITDLSDEE